MATMTNLKLTSRSDPARCPAPVRGREPVVGGDPVSGGDTHPSACPTDAVPLATGYLDGQPRSPRWPVGFHGVRSPSRWGYRWVNRFMRRSITASLRAILAISALAVMPSAIAQTPPPDAPDSPASPEVPSVNVDLGDALGDRHAFRYSIGGCEEMAFNPKRWAPATDLGANGRAGKLSFWATRMPETLGPEIADPETADRETSDQETSDQETSDPLLPDRGDRTRVAASLGDWSTQTAPGRLQFQHTLHFSCCARLALSPTVAADTITIVEHHQGSAGELCRCTCDYEITGELNHLAAGRYRVRVYGVAIGEPAEAIASPLLHETSVVIPPATVSPP